VLSLSLSLSRARALSLSNTLSLALHLSVGQVSAVVSGVRGLAVTVNVPELDPTSRGMYISHDT
jgi:hypothetical protein